MVSYVVNNIEKLRKSHGLTQEQIAEVLGVSRITYINITNGKRDFTTSNLERLSEYFDVPISELFDQPRNVEKFQQMYFYILNRFKDGVPKTKLAKLLYLIDFSSFYENLESMSGVRYVRREYGPVADVFFEVTDDLFEKGKINIETKGDAFLIKPSSKQETHLLSDDDISHINRVVDYWKDKRTGEIVNFTHEQKPWKACRDGEYIPYSLIIQEEPDHVFAPIT
ncbi:MAG: DUF4065 domain-containing protein [Oscillospiraceae bacterium]|nr:DUF4065 domain-containing protein [Oscillospiraceae bacterium]